MERLTDAELEGWYHQLDHIGCMDRIPAKQVLADLRALRAAVRAMPEPDYTDHSCDERVCVSCGERAYSAWHGATVVHAPDCPWVQLRTLAGEGR